MKKLLLGVYALGIADVVLYLYNALTVQSMKLENTVLGIALFVGLGSVLLALDVIDKEQREQEENSRIEEPVTGVGGAAWKLLHEEEADGQNLPA